MKNLLVVLLVAFTIPVMAQETQQRNVGSFSGVKVAEGIDVYLKKGDKHAVRVEVSCSVRMPDIGSSSQATGAS